MKSTTEAIINTAVETTTEIITGVASNATNTERVNILTNSTAVDEGILSNATSVINNSTSILNTTLEGTATEIIQSSTEPKTFAINTFSEIYEDALETTTTFMEHDMYTNSNNTSYIIMGVFIAVLIIIAILLSAFYISCKRKNSARISSKHNKTSQEIATTDINETHQQSPC